MKPVAMTAETRLGQTSVTRQTNLSKKTFAKMTLSVRASVMELSRDGSERDLGVFDFLGLPSGCDRVWLKTASRGLDLMEVLHVDHIPLEADYSRIAGRSSSPNAIVCVRLLENWPNAERA
jgi:hypothetical protein